MEHINITTARFHRNGIAGVGFYAVKFKANNREFLAVSFDDLDNPPSCGFQTAFLRCTGEKPDLSERCRGDDYVVPLHTALKAWCEAHKEEVYG